ncbi:hypothetical protein FIU91_07235 [Roseivivax sp. THAF30]|nr:hypothetical protein FIU91_07235 [Roseivivax sp. THAF30]
MRDAIPLDDETLRHGIADWIDTQSDVYNKAQELDNGLRGVDRVIWDFMKDPETDIPDLEIPTRMGSIVSSVTGLFR